MKIKDLIAALEKCNPEAEPRVRGTIEGAGYIDEEIGGIDDCGDTVIIDI